MRMLGLSFGELEAGCKFEAFFILVLRINEAMRGRYL